MARTARTLAFPRLPTALRSDLRLRLEDGVEWSGAEVNGDFSSEVATGVDITECRMGNATFTLAGLSRVRMTDVAFVGCDLSGTTLHEGALARVEFAGCRMLGFSLAQVQLHDVRFVDCRLDEADLRMARGTRIEFDNCSLKGADFYGARLSDVRLFDSDLTNVEFSQADLAGARLHGSKLEDLRGARYLRDIVIDSTQIIPMAMAMFAANGVRVDDEREAVD